MNRCACLCLVAALACDSKPAATTRRAQLTKLSGNVLEIVPAENQPPYCLVFTIANASKIIRQLTMSRDNRSYSCPAGTPIGNLTFRVPVEEGPVRVYVFFSDKPLNAGSIAQQLFDLSTRSEFNVLDLRAPGRLVSERFDFAPEEEAVPATGGVVGAGGQVQGDAGQVDAGHDGAGAVRDAGV